MGGYGAFKLALNYPENYCAAASLSGVIDLAEHLSHPNKRDDAIRPDFINVFGANPDIRGTRHDLVFTLKKLKADGKTIPRLYLCCGDQDFLVQDSLTFRDLTAQEDVPLTWQIDPGYEHTWDYWDLRIQTVLTWMFGAT